MKKTNLALQVAHIGLPPLRTDGLVELSIQEPTGGMRRVVHNYPADRVPKVGDDLTLADRNQKLLGTFVVMDVKHLLLPPAKETIRAVLLRVQKPYQA